MTEIQDVFHQIVLRYNNEPDDPDRATYRRFPLLPRFSDELALAIRDHPELDMPDVYPENPSQLQVHIVGTARALEEFGRFLIALARLETENPEPSESVDDVRNADGGTVRVIPRRIRERVPPKKRDDSYDSGFRGV